MKTTWDNESELISLCDETIGGTSRNIEKNIGKSCSIWIEASAKTVKSQKIV